MCTLSQEVPQCTGYQTLQDCPVIVGLQNHYKAIHYPLTLSVIPNALPGKDDPAQALQSAAPLTSAPTVHKPEAKKVKIDAPLDAQIIQAQLAKLNQQKRNDASQRLLSAGIRPPPGLTNSTLLDYFIYLSPPPGAGPYAARPHPEQTTANMESVYGKSTGEESSSSTCIKFVLCQWVLMTG
jgi:hypothetical protein